MTIKFGEEFTIKDFGSVPEVIPSADAPTNGFNFVNKMDCVAVLSCCIQEDESLPSTSHVLSSLVCLFLG